MNLLSRSIEIGAPLARCNHPWVKRGNKFKGKTVPEDIEMLFLPFEPDIFDHSSILHWGVKAITRFPNFYRAIICWQNSNFKIQQIDKISSTHKKLSNFDRGLSPYAPPSISKFMLNRNFTQYLPRRKIYSRNFLSGKGTMSRFLQWRLPIYTFRISKYRELQKKLLALTLSSKFWLNEQV